MSPDVIVEYLRERSGRPLRARELARALDVPPDEFAAFKEQLAEMEEDGLLYRVRTNRYAAPEKINLVVGQLRTIRSGAGFVVPEGGGDDLFVPSHALGSAIDGDRVVARVEHRRRRMGRPEGRIIKVLERGRSTIVGTYHPSRNFGFVVPEDRKITRHLFVPPGSDGGAREGDVVVARVTSWGDEHLGPAGEVERVLGAAGEASVDTLAILFGHELPLEFPPDVEREAEQIRAEGIPAAALASREDLRELHVFTIDPVDARDHDDAISVRKLTAGRVEVGVHIADVSAYVEPGGAIDREALHRGTSVYLVDRVVPMLPEVLSGDLCSLVPGEDRLAVSLLMELDRSANVRSTRLVRSVIRSRHKLSYEAAQAILDGGDSPDEDTSTALQSLIEVSRVLRKRRAGRGSLDFDMP
ncbi:MAG TPA: RNB domain-containing ribonuclease, partial [Longimicrobiales bacterium]|nr:RNB domain-containing ribonuclease [Longimicrobiales bacterium]